MKPTDEPVESLVIIPGLGPGERAVVESLVHAAGIVYFSLPGDCGEIGPRIQIRSADLAEVKELLADFRIATPGGELVPIPWELCERVP
jgi:hypothetical protein